MTVTIRQLTRISSAKSPASICGSRWTPQEAAEIEAGMDQYAVLLFRDQDITDRTAAGVRTKLRRA